MKALEYPLVTVGVPTWNRPLDLRRCLEHLLVQTYTNLEIIVSDNCSDVPEVREVLAEFSLRDSRVRCVTQPTNIGATLNFQFLLEEARGELFMWAGDDDWREPEYIALLHAALMRTSGSVIAFCDFIQVDRTGEPLSGQSHLKELTTFTQESRLLRLWGFLLQRENLGKANIIYGLMRRAELRGFNWPKFVARHRGWGADVLFVFWLMGKGPLALAPERLFGFTVGNVKWHGRTDTRQTWLNALHDRSALTWEQIVYSVQYMRLVRGWTRMAIGLAWPFKVLDIVWRLMMVGALRLVVRRTKAVFRVG